MTENPVYKVGTLGQSIWLDFIRRGIISSGELKALMDDDGVRGVTSNPAIFEKAIAGSHDYDSAIRALALEDRKVEDIYETLAVEDVQHATDVFRPLYEKSNRRDGYVSIEVSPHLAHDTAGTVNEAHRLWKAVDRPNVMIKVPATKEGIPAIRTLIGEGINVNVTLIFSVARYKMVADAYIGGLEDRLAKGGAVDHVQSVASIFISRIDVMVDPILEGKIKAGGDAAKIAERAKGQVAVAGAKVAYEAYEEIVAGERWKKLAGKGAQTQRLLWASTSNKDPHYGDTRYVEPLIAVDTVNTMPLETINAYRSQGEPAVRIKEHPKEAHEIVGDIAKIDIDLDDVAQKLEDEGVEKFIKPFVKLMETLTKARDAALGESVDREVHALGAYEKSVKDRVAALDKLDYTTRLWRKDGSLWKSDEKNRKVIENALGWLHVCEKIEESLGGLLEFVQDVKAAGFTHVVHMGMGGSSLAPLSFEQILPKDGGLKTIILDTTDPGTIQSIEKSVPLEKTLFIVASKSGTTAEPLAFGDYFYARMKAKKGERAGENFVSITDPNSYLVKESKERKYRKIFINFADIGGRYSALSYFGLVPAALMGVDVPELLVRALRMQHACASCVPPHENPGVVLGAMLGELAKQGRNKVTFIVPKGLESLGLWMEQLIAESTGKEGSGVFPIAGETTAEPSHYGSDRVFAYFRLAGEDDSALDNRVKSLERAGHPVVTVQMSDRLDLAQEYFRWEIATATAGAVLGINAFDQPNVQESKDNTNRLLDVVKKDGKLPEVKPALTDGALSVYGNVSGNTVTAALKSFLGQIKPGDFVATMAYLTEGPEVEKGLQEIRTCIRDTKKVATTVGYGPRFLHSTGQFHKGGPNMGLFLQLTADGSVDMDVPGKPFSFGVLKQAQAQGDLEALAKHDRRAIRIHLGKDVKTGLAALVKAVKEAIA